MLYKGGSERHFSANVSDLEKTLFGLMFIALFSCYLMFNCIVTDSFRFTPVTKGCPCTMNRSHKWFNEAE
jgi:hypothetical protein